LAQLLTKKSKTMLSKFENEKSSRFNLAAKIKSYVTPSTKTYQPLSRWLTRVGSIGALALIVLTGCRRDDLSTTQAEQVATHKSSLSVPLKWAAPALINPITITLGTGRTSTKLDTTKDYIIKLPTTTKNGSTTLLGGRNVVIIGGNIKVPAGDPTQRALYIKDAVGTVHIEGVFINNPDSAEFDGIAIAAPKAIVQIQRVRIEGLKGRTQSFHSDVIQPWGGVKDLRVDHLTAYSGYQGIQFSALTGPVTAIHLSNINLEGIDQQIWESGSTLGSNGGFLAWAECSFSASGTIENVYLKARPGRGATTTVWPNSSTSCASTIAADQSTITWPFPAITGSFTVGRPANGDYVPSGSVGLTYQP
jgi:hypothetical protein